MKFSENWLRTWVNPKLTRLQLAELLSLAGIEVVAVTPVAHKFSGVKIGRIAKVTPHPNANRLRICEVIINENSLSSQSATIVCGACNAREGLLVAAALPGAQLANGAIKARLLRGIKSEGMLCSTEELGLTEHPLHDPTHSGIAELPDHLPIGADLWEILQLDDHCIEIQITPNRGDCLSLQGIAREIAALTDNPVTAPTILSTRPTHTEVFPIQVTAKNACPNYIGRILRNLNPHAKIPYWMAERLQRSGYSSIHPIVDITHYVLLELGNPLHVFDLKALSESLSVRFAKPDESLTLLNGKTVHFDENTLIIADEKGPQAIAGIMGGLSSAVSEKTTDIFLESAFFSPDSIAGRARQYGLNTDASYRFERGVDPALCQKALDRATDLLLSICDGQAGPLITAKDVGNLPICMPVKLREKRIHALSGLSLPPQTIITLLNRLGIMISPNTDAEHAELAWQVQAPSWRFDLNEEVDFIEEVVRMHGYHNIPTKLPCFPIHLSSKENAKQLSRLRYFWADQGYCEIINYTFISEAQQAQLNLNQVPIKLSNPLSTELDVLRTSLWPGLLQIALYNQHRQQDRMCLFEIGPLFHKQSDEAIIEPTYLGGLATGFTFEEQWGVSARNHDLFDIKQVIQNSLQLSDNTANYRFKAGVHPALQPGQSSQILKDEQCIGWLGALHPRLIHSFGFANPVYLFEWQLGNLTWGKPTAFQPLSRFPWVRRDLAFWVSDRLPLDSILSTIRSAAGDCLIALKLFDLYKPTEKHNDLKQESLHSVAVGLIFQHAQRTLTESEVGHWQAQVIQMLKARYAIQLRDQ